MSQEKAVKPAIAKAEFITQNLPSYQIKYSFLPIKQIKGKLEADWKRLYGPKPKSRTISKTIPKDDHKPGPTPAVIVKPEIVITKVPNEPQSQPQSEPQSPKQLLPRAQSKSQLISKSVPKSQAQVKPKITNLKSSATENDGGHDGGGEYADNRDNPKPIKRKMIKEEVGKTHRLRSKKDKLETTIELLSSDNKSIGFIERNGNDTFLKLHNGKTLPWSHSTPVRVTRNNTHLNGISRLPFSPI